MMENMGHNKKKQAVGTFYKQRLLRDQGAFDGGAGGLEERRT